MKNILCALLGILVSLPVLGGNVGRSDALTITEGLKLEVSLLQDSTRYYYVMTKSSARFFSDMDNLSSVLEMIPKNTEVQVFEPIGDYYSAYYNESYGFLLISKVKPVNFDPEKAFRPQIPEPVEGASQDRYSILLGKYDRETADLIRARKVWQGMTKQMVLDSWGKPRKIDRYIGKTSVKEEWYYRTKVLFIKDGQLVGWK